MVCCRGNAVDSRLFHAIINKIPATISAVLPHRTSFSSYLEKEYAEMERNLKATLNVHVEARGGPAECN